MGYWGQNDNVYRWYRTCDGGRKEMDDVVLLALWYLTSVPGYKASPGNRRAVRTHEGHPVVVHFARLGSQPCLLEEAESTSTRVGRDLGYLEVDQ